MSRVGKKILSLPSGVTCDVRNGIIVVNGPKGELSLTLHHFVRVNQGDDGVVISVSSPAIKEQRALWGTFGALIGNMIHGVSVGFTKELEIQGVGYTWSVDDKKITVKAGYSHPVVLPIPVELTAVIGEGSVLTIAGCDKQQVGAFAAEVRNIRKPEPYKGKGIRYRDEHVRRKAGKQSATA